MEQRNTQSDKNKKDNKVGKSNHQRIRTKKAWSQDMLVTNLQHTFRLTFGFWKDITKK